jgi:hypothetical protein
MENLMTTVENRPVKLCLGRKTMSMRPSSRTLARDRLLASSCTGAVLCPRILQENRKRPTTFRCVTTIEVGSSTDRKISLSRLEIGTLRISRLKNK